MTFSPFVGQGTPNPQALFIPRKDSFDADTKAAFLAIQNWANALRESGGGGLTQFSQTYSVSGTLFVASGPFAYLPPFFTPVQAGQTIALFAVRYEVRAGSATMNILHNGTTIASGLAVTTAPTTTTIAQAVANNDTFQPFLTAVSGADGLSCSFYFQVS